MITRFAVLPDERRLLLGVDHLNLFKAGVVYEATEMLGEIILKPIGEYALPKQGVFPCEFSETNPIVESGMHLYTKEEASRF